MRRYWFSIILSVFIVVAISTYYVYGSSDLRPWYKLSTVEGDVKEGMKIHLKGSYFSSNSHQFVNDIAEVNDNPSRYSIFRDRYSARARSELAQDPDIRQIIKEHRSFMRGKGNANSFYADEEWVIYVEGDINNVFTSNPRIILKIDLLNQTSGEVKHYETIVDEQTPYIFSYVEDVQLIEDQIHILTYQTQKKADMDVSDTQQYREYILDMNSGALTNHEVLNFGIATKDHVNLKSNNIKNAISTAPSDYAVFIVGEDNINITAVEGGQKYEFRDKYFFSYSYKTGELKDITAILNTVGMKEYSTHRLESSVLSILNYGSEGMTISHYNLDTEKLDKEVVSLTVQQLGADQIRTGKMKNDRVYILFHKNEIPMVAVVNANNGDILYKGEVVYDGDSSESKEQMKNVRFTNIQIAE